MKIDEQAFPPVDLAVVGCQCVLHDASELPKYSCLLKCSEYDLLLDRFDVRLCLINNHTFDEILHVSPIQHYCSVDEDEDLTRNESEYLFQERFGDIPKDASVAFQHFNEKYICETENTPTFEITGDLFPNLPEKCFIPSDKRTLSIILHTVKTVGEKGMQFEILLRTQLANNERLSFMDESSKFNLFYQYLRSLEGKQFKDILLASGTSDQKNVGDLLEDTRNYRGYATQNLDALITHVNVENGKQMVSDEQRTEDLLDYDTDADKPWGRNNFECALIHKRKFEDDKKRQKSNRLKVAKLMKGHFLLQSKQSSVQTVCNIDDSDPTQVIPTLQGHDFPTKVSSGLQLLSGLESW